MKYLFLTAIAIKETEVLVKECPLLAATSILEHILFSDFFLCDINMTGQLDGQLAATWSQRHMQDYSFGPLRINV